MTDTQKAEEVSTIAGKLPDMTQNSQKNAFLKEPGTDSMSFTPVETYTNILTILCTTEHGSRIHVESYTKKQTPPPDNKKKTSQIVHSINNKTMKLKNQAPKPPTKGNNKPKKTGTNRRKSTRKNEAGNGPELEAPPKLTRTSGTNAFATSTAEKQKRIRSPTKSPTKKTKQKYSNVTPMEEDESWKTVLGKAYRKTKKVLKGDDSDEEWPTEADFFPSDDEEASTDDEVKFIKKTRVQTETVLSSSEDDDDPEVEILGVKKAKTNYYANLAPTAKEEEETEEDEEEDDDKEADDEEAGDDDHPTSATQTATKFGYEDTNDELSSDEEESKDEDPSSEESSEEESSEEESSEEEPSASDNESTSYTSSHSSKKKQKKNKNNKNSRGYKSGSNKNNHKNTDPSTKTNKTNILVPNKANPTESTGTLTPARFTLPNEPTPFHPLSSNKADPPKTPVSASSKLAAKKTPQPGSSNKLNRPKTSGTTLPESSAKKTVQKDTSKLVQSNLMNMFNKVAYTAADNIKSAIKDSKGKMKPDKTEKETLPSLPHDGSESEEEIPMKPPATSNVAPDPNDDWDSYTEDATMTGKEKKRKQRRTDSMEKRNKTKQTVEGNDGWSDLDVSEADLDLSGDEIMIDATDAETETGKLAPRESRFTKGMSKADRKFIRQQRKAGSEMSDKDLIAARAELKAEAAAQANTNKKKTSTPTDDDSIMTEVTADTTVVSASTQDASETRETEHQGPGTPKRRGDGIARRSTEQGGRGGRGRGTQGRGGLGGSNLPISGGHCPGSQQRPPTGPTTSSSRSPSKPIPTTSSTECKPKVDESGQR